MKTDWREMIESYDLKPDPTGQSRGFKLLRTCSKEEFYQDIKARLIEELKVGLSVNDIETIQHPYKGTVCRLTYSKDGPLSAFLFEDSDDKS